ncbi:hypothetical protein A3848_27820 [Paenibacillus sp. P32E]|nr:hypothetical protein A3848_27820 [Paenibacillus sp. P32E]
MLHRYFLFFFLLKCLKGVDYFKHDKVKGMYRFLMGTVTAADTLQGGVSGSPVLLTPAVGDANVQEKWFRLLGYAAPFYTEEDPQLAGEMIWTWKRGGAPVEDNGAYPLPLVALLYPQPNLPEQQPALGSVHYPDIGYVIFRSGEQNLQHYAIYEASPLTYHAHHDEGHFSIWANGVSVTLDSGTGGYYNGDRHWYVSGAAHNVVQFDDKSGRFANGPLRSNCKEVRFSEELDYVRSRIPDANAREYERNFVFIKAGCLYKITRSDGAWFIAAINGTGQSRHITVPDLGPLRLLGEPETAEPGQPEPMGLRLEAGRIHIAMPR